jgi:nicotinate-nucleotide adenylyltransferase
MVPGPDGREGPISRIGLLGGTFDPPHVGHVTVARDVAEALSLKRVLWVPAAVPPHKQDHVLTPDAIRMEMVQAACETDGRFEACDIELERGGVSYTVDTLRALRGRWPDSDLYLILGVDQFRTMDTGWKDPDQVLRLATLAVMDRDGAAAREAVPEVPGAEDASFLPVTRVDVSSTEVRGAVREGRGVSGMVPAGVMEIIEREGLYVG